MKEVQKQTTFINSSWLLNNAIYYFFLQKISFFKLYWTYLLYTVKSSSN